MTNQVQTSEIRLDESVRYFEEGKRNKLRNRSMNNYKKRDDSQESISDQFWAKMKYETYAGGGMRVFLIIFT